MRSKLLKVLLAIARYFPFYQSALFVCMMSFALIVEVGAHYKLENLPLGCAKIVIMRLFEMIVA